MYRLQPSEHDHLLFFRLDGETADSRKPQPKKNEPER